MRGRTCAGPAAAWHGDLGVSCSPSPTSAQLPILGEQGSAPQATGAKRGWGERAEQAETLSPSTNPSGNPAAKRPLRLGDVQPASFPTSPGARGSEPTGARGVPPSPARPTRVSSRTSSKVEDRGGAPGLGALGRGARPQRAASSSRDGGKGAAHRGFAFLSFFAPAALLPASQPSRPPPARASPSSTIPSAPPPSPPRGASGGGAESA